MAEITSINGNPIVLAQRFLNFARQGRELVPHSKATFHFSFARPFHSARALDDWRIQLESILSTKITFVDGGVAPSNNGSFAVAINCEPAAIADPSQLAQNPKFVEWCQRNAGMELWILTGIRNATSGITFQNGDPKGGGSHIAAINVGAPGALSIEEARDSFSSLVRNGPGVESAVQRMLDGIRDMNRNLRGVLAKLEAGQALSAADIAALEMAKKAMEGSQAMAKGQIDGVTGALESLLQRAKPGNFAAKPEIK